MTHQFAHSAIEPKILFMGTPVVLISTVNEDGTSNLSPMSSAFWIGWRAMLGLNAVSKTTHNLIRARECVLNLPTPELAPAVDRLALTTGSDPVPTSKQQRGYRYVADKFGRAGLTEVPSDTVAPPRVAECPVAMEGVLIGTYTFAKDKPEQAGSTMGLEVQITRVFIHHELREARNGNHIDPDAWHPLIMKLRRLYGLGAEIHSPTLARVPNGTSMDAATAEHNV